MEQICEKGKIVGDFCSRLNPVPECVPITCNQLHTDGMNWNHSGSMNDSLDMYHAGTNGQLACQKENYYFNYPDGGENFTSYSETINIKEINLSCSYEG